MKADLSMSLIAKLEQGKKADPRASTLLALAGALGVKPGAILEDLLPPPPEPGGEPETNEAAADGAGTKKKKKKKHGPKRKDG
jgi:transcriptional regulator with XRE-family HTH domain